jgi:hypothetical protein
MTSFTVGDVVKRVSGSYNAMGISNIDIVTKVDGYSINLMCYGAGHEETQLALVRHGVIPNFKVGEEVEYVGDGSSSDYLGHKFEIARIENEYFRVHCHALEPVSHYTASDNARIRSEYPDGNWNFKFYEVVSLNRKVAKVKSTDLYLIVAKDCYTYTLIKEGLNEAIKQANQEVFVRDWGNQIDIYKLDKVGSVCLETKIKEKKVKNESTT